LDEPTSGLDPQARANLWQHIIRLREERRVTVFLTTHYLEEADALCDRVFVIDGGEIVASGTPAELKRAVSGDRVQLRLAHPAKLGAARAVGERLRGAVTLRSDGDQLDVRVPDASVALEREGIGLAGIEVRRPTLRAPGSARHLRSSVRGLRTDRRAAQRRDRAHASDAGVADGAADRARAARRDRADGAVGAADRGGVRARAPGARRRDRARRAAGRSGGRRIRGRVLRSRTSTR
jgi:ABC-type sugar transport system ATPase subunit